MFKKYEVNGIKTVKFGRIQFINWGKEVHIVIHLTKNKVIEIQTGYYAEFKEIPFGLELTFKRKMDHPGFHLDINFFPVYFYLSFYDRRHLEDF